MRSIITTLLILFTLSSFAGRGYELYHTQDGVEVYGKWKTEKAFGKGPLVLCLKIVNTTDSALSVDMEVNYYNVATINESTEVKSLCLPAGKKRKGRKHGLCLLSENLSNEEMLDEAFHWKVEELAVKPVEACE